MKLQINYSINFFYYYNVLKLGGGYGCGKNFFVLVGGFFVLGRFILCLVWLELFVMELLVRNVRNVYILGKWN